MAPPNRVGPPVPSATGQQGEGNPMVNFRNKRLAAPVALLVSLVRDDDGAPCVWGSAATSAAPSRPAAAAAAGRWRTGPQGELRSRIVGETANGREVTGKFVPLNFSEAQRQGVRPRPGPGRRAQGRRHRRATFGVMRTVRVEVDRRVRRSGRPAPLPGAPPATSSTWCSARSTSTSSGSQVAPQQGGPQHRRAVRVPGNLLGNLLCAVAGLLDGGLNGLLGRLDQRCSTGSSVSSAWASDPETVRATSVTRT